MSDAIEIGLHAAVVAVEDDGPLVLTVRGDTKFPALPFGPFRPSEHRTLEAALRGWVEDQTQLTMGYVEQLYTFGDRGRLHTDQQGEKSFVSVGYLTLVKKTENITDIETQEWRPWYQHLPWEDWRLGPPPLLTESILPALSNWAESAPDRRSGPGGLDRTSRLRLAFGCDVPWKKKAIIEAWDEERVLERYELMYEAGLVEEAVFDGRFSNLQSDIPTGQPMIHDHRRILATAIARLRGKLKYRPIVFELMQDSFTLTQLQQTVESLSGQRVHKQNFRRMVENSAVVEPTGATTSQTGGRPAALYRFRRSILKERPAPGLKIRPSS